MNSKCILSAVVMIVLTFLLSWFVHGVLIGGDYQQMKWMRPQAEAHGMIPIMILAHVFFGSAFAWIYVQGREDKPWLMQGIRFGLAVAALAIVPIYLIYHVVTPVPLAVAIKQIVFDSIRVVIMGIVLAWMNR